jgi:SAM-dependent methyltransferase
VGFDVARLVRRAGHRGARRPHPREAVEQRARRGYGHRLRDRRSGSAGRSRGRRWPGARDAEVVHHNLGELGITNVELREADIARLPLATDSVDAAVANVVLHRAESPAAVLGEMARVTKPGGWVAVTDAVEHPYEWMRTEHAD